MEERTKVTTEALRLMPMGSTLVFRLPDAAAINTGKSIAYRIKHVFGCRFSIESDYVNNTLTVTKMPL